MVLNKFQKTFRYTPAEIEISSKILGDWAKYRKNTTSSLKKFAKKWNLSFLNAGSAKEVFFHRKYPTLLFKFYWACQRTDENFSQLNKNLKKHYVWPLFKRFGVIVQRKIDCPLEVKTDCLYANKPYLKKFCESLIKQGVEDLAFYNVGKWRGRYYFFDFSVA